MLERLINARVHEHLSADLDRMCESMNLSRLLTNSAALWWFLNKLSAPERAEIVGEYVKVLAMLGQRQAEENAPTKKGKEKGQRAGNG
jgi:hypothetical protein